MEPAAAPAGGVGCLDDLGIDDHRGRPGIAALAGAQRAAQPVYQARGQSPGAPPVKERVHRRPGREVRRQRPPLDAVLDHVEHRIQHRPQVMVHRPSAGPHQAGHHLPGLGFQDLPLRVAQIRGITADAVMAPAPRRRATGIPGRNRVDRHPGLLELEGVDTSPVTGVLLHSTATRGT